MILCNKYTPLTFDTNQPNLLFRCFLTSAFSLVNVMFTWRWYG